MNKDCEKILNEEVKEKEPIKSAEIRDLKVQIEKISKKYNLMLAEENLVNKLTGSKFNVFTSSGISQKEVYICNFLVELLKPEGNHCQGETYLKLFLKLLSQKSKAALDLCTQKTKVYKEILTKNLLDKDKRRIDIAIKEAGGYYIPIEVKINAGEQTEQCNDYIQQVKNYYCENGLTKLKPLLVFLTKDGHFPTTIEYENKEWVVCLSWKEDIINWINACIENTPQTTISIRTVLNQLKLSVNEFTNNNEENNIKTGIINESRELYHAYRKDIDKILQNSDSSYMYKENKEIFEIIREDCNLDDEIYTIICEYINENSDGIKEYLTDENKKLVAFKRDDLSLEKIADVFFDVLKKGNDFIFEVVICAKNNETSEDKEIRQDLITFLCKKYGNFCGSDEWRYSTSKGEYHRTIYNVEEFERDKYDRKIAKTNIGNKIKRYTDDFIRVLKNFNEE